MKLLFDVLVFVDKHIKNKDGIQFVKSCKWFLKIWKSHIHQELVEIEYNNKITNQNMRKYKYWNYKGYYTNYRYSSITDNPIDISRFKSSHTLTLHNIVIDDLSALTTTQNLTIDYCYMLAHLTVLKTVHTLTLRSINNINKIIIPKTVHTLTIMNCPHVVDVSNLGTVHTLSLYNCSSIVDVSALGTVHTLTISNCPKIVGTSALKSVHNLTIYKKELSY
jgi:hypothetical protein